MRARDSPRGPDQADDRFRLNLVAFFHTQLGEMRELFGHAQTPHLEFFFYNPEQPHLRADGHPIETGLGIEVDADQRVPDLALAIEFQRDAFAEDRCRHAVELRWALHFHVDDL